MNIVELKDNKTVPDIVHEYTEDIRSSDTPLIIDNGSYQCRVGWTTQRQPLLIFKNLIAKPRKERVRKDGEPPVTPPIQIGNDIVNIEAVRFQLKTQFDKNVVTHFEAQEQILDYAFSHLGIENEGSIPHPIVMTEAFLNPNYSRNLMSELLFECYGIPALSYGVDALFSFYYNQPGLTPNSVVNQDSKHSGLIVSCGYHTTHVIPILYGKCYPEHTRRINLGGFHLATYLHRLLQLKYPVHVNAISLSRVEELLHGHCSIALDYQEQLKAWTATEHYEKNVKKVQLPFVQPVVSVGLTAEQRGERRKELARRLTEMNARRREERLAEDEDRLSRLRDVLAYVHAGYDIDEVEGCEDLEVKTSDDVEKAIIVHQARIERTRQKMAAVLAGGPGTPGGILEDQETSKQALPMLPPSGLELSEWIESTKKRRTVIIERRTARKQRRTDMARRRTAAAQERMRIISQLARKEKGTDDFGMRDEDWDVYKTISKEGGDSDSEVENEKLIELEDILRQFDPSFDENMMASRQMTSGIQNSDTLGEAHQLHVGVEAIRTPELLFQPSMTGSMEAGLAETIEYVLKQFDSESQLKLSENVFLTGGCASFPGLKERLSRELLQMRPFKSFHKVTIARDPNLDAWNGARSLGLDPRGSFVTRSDYEEMGGEYLKEHYASNQYHKSPGSIAVEDV